MRISTESLAGSLLFEELNKTQIGEEKANAKDKSERRSYVRRETSTNVFPSGEFHIFWPIRAGYAIPVSNVNACFFDRPVLPP